MASSKRKNEHVDGNLSDNNIDRVLEDLDKSDIDISEGEDEDLTVDPTQNRRAIGYSFNFGEDCSDHTDSDPDFDINLEQHYSSDTSSDKETNPDPNQPSGSKGKKKKQPAKKRRTERQAKGKDIGPKWTTGVFTPDQVNLHQPSYYVQDSSNWSDDDFINQYFDDDILSTIVNKSNQNYILKTGKTLGVSLEELKVWLGINFVMGAIQLPKIRMYWEQGLRLPLVSNAMSRDRFFLIRTSLKVVFDIEVTDDERKADRLWKVRPLLDRVLSGCRNQPRSQHISIDEMMVPFSGSCSLRQFVPNKPNPVGLKVFVLANPNGVVCDFTVYQGKSTFPDETGMGFSLGESAVLHLTRSLVPGHTVYVDRYFNTVKLVNELASQGIRCSGTIMKNRLPKNTDLPDIKQFNKQERGSTVVTVNESKSMAICLWKDNSAVVMLSSNESIEPISDVRRWSKTEKRYVTVPQPKVIASYNKNMGGVDLADRMLSYCPSRARTKKWTIRCLMHFFDLSLTNAWLQMREVKKECRVPAKDIPQFRTFKLNFGKKLILENSFGQPDSDTDSEPDNEMRVDGRKSKIPSIIERSKGKHLPDYENDRQQKRCRMPKCDKKTTVFCSKCKVNLCFVPGRNCFKLFHSK